MRGRRENAESHGKLDIFAEIAKAVASHRTPKGVIGLAANGGCSDTTV
jgi:hypothetical protein